MYWWIPFRKSCLFDFYETESPHLCVKSQLTLNYLILTCFYFIKFCSPDFRIILSFFSYYLLLIQTGHWSSLFHGVESFHCDFWAISINSQLITSDHTVQKVMELHLHQSLTCSAKLPTGVASSLSLNIFLTFSTRWNPH